MSNLFCILFVEQCLMSKFQVRYGVVINLGIFSRSEG